MTRDFVGYGAEPPHAQWPGEARVAVNFVINFEEGSELSYPAGDAVSETGLIESASTDAGNRRDLAAESMFEYGSRVGWWRLHRIFTGFNLPVTLFACARALEANPPAAAAIAATDWDICGHGYRWIKHYELDESAERDQIARAVALIRQTTGKPTEGWYCRYAPSENTRNLVALHGGFLYDSDAYNDELPYWVRVSDTPHLVCDAIFDSGVQIGLKRALTTKLDLVDATEGLKEGVLNDVGSITEATRPGWEPAACPSRQRETLAPEEPAQGTRVSGPRLREQICRRSR